MLKEEAIVIAYAQGIATIKTQRQSYCGSCVAKPSCGTAIFGKLTTEARHKGELVFTVPSLTPLKAGQRLEIGLRKKALLLSSLLLYAVPLLALLLATLFSSHLFQQEFIQAIFIFLCTASSFLGVKYLSYRLLAHPHYQIVLLRILS